MANKIRSYHVILFIAMVIPILEIVLPSEFHISEPLRPIFIFSLLGLGLNVLTGYTGLLNLGVSAFMAIGAYAYSILSCDIYPFQLGFWLSTLCATLIGALSGFLLGLPTIRLRGDYLAIVTLGFGEIVQDSLRNLYAITKGSQGINPLPPPSFIGFNLDASNSLGSYYLLLFILIIVVALNFNVEHSRVGRRWIALREDELASTCMGLNAGSIKLQAFAICAAVCALSGALWASYLGSSGEPGNYDFQVSIIALCIIIVGGLGNIGGVLLGSFLMIGFNSILLVKLSGYLSNHGLVSSANVLSSPNNWKYMIFGLALILTMRFRPDGILPRYKGKGARG